ncbi:DegT/DnrJ/EryC1/StrS aminotransferase family protein [uncultured Paraglaciecola sp.]|uniref:DegT/DnrJ/EryC1/StrS family aminotransferase n=1 Tax=uncultured Paraglaciecola sp. TaxID=1765024 RepID=UPI002635C87B|nr:DegT/DnrJ/EryC1/StrS aminotransferase family protein [uncultured Paraglaciecola sp.]
MSKIHYTKPSIHDLEVKYATDAAKNGWGENCYQYILRFEEQFKKYLGVRYAIATSSCTGALHMGLSALGIQQGDEVILADINWIATVAPITYLGAKPVLVDIDPNNWCIDPAKVIEVITANTKAIIATHIYGNLCAMGELQAISEQYGIPIIEDAAEAVGSEYQSIKAGSLGTFGVFSFHGTKTVTTGEGGMFVTNDAKVYEKVLTLSNHGRATNQEKQFWPSMIGFKYKMSNIQAAIGCAQVERIEELVAKKRAVFYYYENKLSHIKEISMNEQSALTKCSYWMPTIVFAEQLNIDRDKLLTCFSQQNIDARLFFWPLSQLDMFEDKPDNVNAYSISKRSINLPSYHDITEPEMDRVCLIISSFLKNSKDVMAVR